MKVFGKKINYPESVLIIDISIIIHSQRRINVMI
jgi:hypothetical protein